MKLTARLNIKRVLINLVKKDEYTNEEANALYATHAIMGLACTLVGIYIPLYIFELASNFPNLVERGIINSLVYICLFYALSSLTVILSTVIFDVLLARITLKKSMFYSIMLFIAHFFFVLWADTNVYALIPAAILWGLHITLYYIPYHIFFARRADDGDKKYGSETGRRDFYVGVFAAMGPLLGGLIITQMGFTALYLIAMILLLVSTIPILVFVEENKHFRHKFKDIYKGYFINKDYAGTTLSLGGIITSATIFGIFWSVMLYLGLSSFTEIGFLNTLPGIFSTVLMLIVGKIIDLKGKRVIHAFGVVINTAMHVSRLFFGSIGFLYANNIIDVINSSAYSVPFNAKIYEKSLESNVIDFMIYRELVLHLTRLFIILFVIGLLLLTGTWRWVFIVGSLGSALTYLVNF